jgi:gas vesicle protein
MGGTVSDRTSILWCALAGAVVGGAAGYLLFTDEGRRLRENLEPKLVDLMTEFEKARSLMDSGTQSRADVRPFAR